MPQSITPFLLFESKAEEAIRFTSRFLRMPGFFRHLPTYGRVHLSVWYGFAGLAGE